MRGSTFIVPFFLPAAYGQLDTLAKAAGLKYFGSATDNGELSDTSYVDVLSNTSEFGQITPGNTQKWDYTEATQNVFTFTEGEVVTSFAENNSQILRCHNLVWYSQIPTWVSGVTNWKGQCYAWDVVNEPLDDDGGWRDNIFYSTIGPYYVNIAFAAAAAADPSAKLYLNDYNIESGTKMTNALAIVKQIQDAGVQIDGVGIEAHYVLGSTPTQSALESALNEYTALGVEVAITELDIRMTSDSTANLEQQGTEFADVTRACLNVDDCIGITVWDLDDKYSWVPDTFSGYGYACLWDENLSKKPAYYSVVDALKSSNRTTTTSSVSNNSSVAISATTSSIYSTAVLSSATQAAAVEATSSTAVLSSTTGAATVKATSSSTASGFQTVVSSYLSTFTTGAATTASSPSIFPSSNGTTPTQEPQQSGPRTSVIMVTVTASDLAPAGGAGDTCGR